VLFLGTPHKGSDSAGWARVLGKMVSASFKATSKFSILMSLRSFPEQLTQLDEEFFQFVRNRASHDPHLPLRVVSFYEEQAVRHIGIVGVVVLLL
jgi:hypothetical protein